ncbi:MAG: DUF309 domain-containing protein [Nitrospirota bacterium]
MHEPEPPDLNWPRYSCRPFPSYRFVPGRNPHPRRDPRGHSYHLPEARPAPFSPEAWAQSEDFLYGIDLYNFAYWWESHEVFEGLWHAAGHQSEQGRFFQAFIHLAAAHLKRFTDQEPAANRLFVSGLARLERFPPLFMGVDVARLTAGIRSALADPTAQPILVRLLMS